MLGAELRLQRRERLLDQILTFRLARSDLSLAQAGAGFGELPALVPHNLLSQLHCFFQEWGGFGGAAIERQQVALGDEGLAKSELCSGAAGAQFGDDVGKLGGGFCERLLAGGESRSSKSCARCANK